MCGNMLFALLFGKKLRLECYFLTLNPILASVTCNDYGIGNKPFIVTTISNYIPNNGGTDIGFSGGGEKEYRFNLR